VWTKEQLHTHLSIQLSPFFVNRSNTSSNLGSLPTYDKELTPKLINLEGKVHNTTSQDRVIITHLHERK
jgi:hypothetical protein